MEEEEEEEEEDGWMVEPERKNFLRPTGGGCHHADLRIAAGTESVNAI